MSESEVKKVEENGEAIKIEEKMDVDKPEANKKEGTDVPMKEEGADSPVSQNIENDKNVESKSVSDSKPAVKAVKETKNDNNSAEKSDSVDEASKDAPKPVDDEKGKNTEENDKEESEEEESEEELAPGLLERPVVIEGGRKRERKKTARLEINVPSATEKKIEIPEGSGQKLGDIPRVEYNLSKTHPEDLKIIHRFVFGRAGSVHEVRKNLRKFCGFAFKKGSQEYDKKSQQLMKYNQNQLRVVRQVLDVELKGAKKPELVERIIDFLMDPKDSGKAVPKKGKKRKRGDGKKKKKEKKSKDDEGSADDDDDDDEDHDDEDDNDDEEESDNEDKDNDESEDEQPKKKRAKKTTPKKPAKEKKKREPKKKAEKKPKKATPKKKKVEVEPEDTSSTSDSELNLPKKKGPPTEDEIKDLVKKILEGANLEEVTMKTVCKQVFAKYPEFDLTDKKDFIKNTVRQIIS